MMRRRVKAAPEWILLSGSKPNKKKKTMRGGKQRWTAATDAHLGAPHELSEQQSSAAQCGRKRQFAKKKLLSVTFEGVTLWFPQFV